MKHRSRRPHKPKAQTFELRIEEIGARGDGIGWHDGKSVFVPRAAAGDVLRVTTISENREGTQARIQAILEAGAGRSAAPCLHYEQCGGCSLQHVGADFYRNWKIERVRSVLDKASVKPQHWRDPVFLPPATRRRASLAALRLGKTIRLGFQEVRSHKVTDIQSCLVLHPALEKLVKDLRPYLLRLLPEGKICDIALQLVSEAMDMVITGPLEAQPGKFSLEQLEAMAEMVDVLDIARLSHRAREFDTPAILLNRKPVIKAFGPMQVGLPPAAFLQASAESESALSKLVLEAVGNEAMQVADLFAGCGSFTGPLLLQDQRKVSAFENDAAACAALSAAAKNHSAFEVQRRDLFDLPLKAKELAAFGAVVIDPPRAGAAAQYAELAWSDVPRIAAVSCNPATFARDARLLADEGYVLEWLAVIDQFVWSAHIETAGLFVRR